MKFEYNRKTSKENKKKIEGKYCNYVRRIR